VTGSGDRFRDETSISGDDGDSVNGFGPRIPDDDVPE